MAEEDNYRMEYVYLTFNEKLEQDFFKKSNVTFKVVNLHKKKPLVQLGNYVFQGKYEDCLGTNVFFKECDTPRQKEVFKKEPPIHLDFFTKSTKCISLKWIEIPEEVNQIYPEEVVHLNFNQDYRLTLKKFKENKLDIKEIVVPMTKKSTPLTDPTDASKHTDKAKPTVKHRLKVKNKMQLLKKEEREKLVKERREKLAKKIVELAKERERLTKEKERRAKEFKMFTEEEMEGLTEVGEILIEKRVKLTEEREKPLEEKEENFEKKVGPLEEKKTPLEEKEKVTKVEKRKFSKGRKKLILDEKEKLTKEERYKLYKEEWAELERQEAEMDKLERELLEMEIKENAELEREELEREVLEREELEREELERQELERKKLEREEFEKKGLGKKWLGNESLEREELKRKKLEKAKEKEDDPPPDEDPTEMYELLKKLARIPMRQQVDVCKSFEPIPEYLVDPRKAKSVTILKKLYLQDLSYKEVCTHVDWKSIEKYVDVKSSIAEGVIPNDLEGSVDEANKNEPRTFIRELTKEEKSRLISMRNFHNLCVPLQLTLLVEQLRLEKEKVTGMSEEERKKLDDYGRTPKDRYRLLKSFAKDVWYQIFVKLARPENEDD